MSQSELAAGEADGHGVLGNEFTPEDVAAVDTSRKARLRKPLLLLAPIVLIVAALAFYLHGGRYQSTDDAALQAGQVAVAPSISGTVIEIEVHENQPVRAGQLLFRIDPAPFRAAVAQAEAGLADARTQVGALQANFRQGQAELQAAHDRLDFAVREAARQKELLAEGISSQSQYDQAALEARTARQGIATTTQKAEAVRASLAGSVDAPVDSQPAVQRAKAVLDRARIDLAHTEVRALQAGIVTRVNQLQIGSYVSASRPVFTLVGQRIWVEANFKENQLRYMRIGQAATIKVDAYPDRPLKAQLTSFSPGTGNSFALLPPENATGNWVKVVQRLPVEFTLLETPGDLPLHAGLSAEVTVDTGHKRHLFGSGSGK